MFSTQFQLPSGFKPLIKAKSWEPDSYLHTDIIMPCTSMEFPSGKYIHVYTCVKSSTGCFDILEHLFMPLPVTTYFYLLLPENVLAGLCISILHCMALALCFAWKVLLCLFTNHLIAAIIIWLLFVSVMWTIVNIHFMTMIWLIIKVLYISNDVDFLMSSLSIHLSSLCTSSSTEGQSGECSI